MFNHNLGTKDLIDALILCREAMLNLPNQKIPRSKGFTDTLTMGGYLDGLIKAAEGRASGASKVKASSLSADQPCSTGTACCGAYH